MLDRTWDELASLQADAEALDADIDAVESESDSSDDWIGSHWANEEYARGERLLRQNRTQLPPPDFAFLGALRPLLAALSKEACKIVNSTSVLVQVALQGLLEESDYGPQIAGMAKACERILDDVFKQKKNAIETDTVFGEVISDEPSWHYQIPADMAKVTAGDLTNVVKLVKRSIESDTAIKWNGMGNKRIGLLLLGGWIPVCQGPREHPLNPLGVDRSGEYARILPDRLSELQNLRNGFVHHDLADIDALRNTWRCFQDCLKGLLQACYSAGTSSC
jgi:hypothetical protein